MRIALGVEYNGTHFKGWESQPGQRTVQGCLEVALSKVANAEIKVVAAGRTDAGVHALEQVVHFDTQVSRDPYNWMLGITSSLPKDIAVHWAARVDDEFHARFSALTRRYRYLLLNRRARPGVLPAAMSWHPRHLDEAHMHEAAQALLGTHDFSAFRASSCQAHTATRRIVDIKVSRLHDTLIIDVEANAFLHNMVRNIAGVLIAIGEGVRPVSWAAEVLASKDRRQGGVTATPDGLYLVAVTYPQSVQLPQRSSDLGFCL
ncbi:MAG: tRNA pseudouridine(38-40) synthase TruA [Gammaproteobacteria bacterium]|nr:tRNA pseudouridine(38-40) synthase TruA [Gammaproteobacteria bacterium]PCH80726.1 MAG: tRNA pseudouridine(38-40) synthase TruA [Hyphomicrobiales bacterium]